VTGVDFAVKKMRGKAGKRKMCDQTGIFSVFLEAGF